jgi:hypothetical protein
VPSNNSYPNLINDWGELIEALDRTPELQPTLEEDRLALEQSLADVQTLRARQAELRALRQEATQQLQEAVTRGKDSAIRIRSLVRGRIGPRSERLVHFNVAPLRRRVRRPTDSPPAPTEPEEPQEPPDGGAVEAAKATSGPSPSDKTVA